MVRTLVTVLLALWSTAATADDRVTAWREDIAVARTDFLQRDRSFTSAMRAAADAALTELSAHADHLDDAEIVAGLARAAALAGNAHTRAYILRNRGVWRRYPIRIWKFGDEWRVIAAQPDHADLLGARLLRIAGAPVDLVAARVRPLFAGNDFWARYMATYSLTSPDALTGVGALHGEGSARFDFERGGRRMRVTLAPMPFARREVPEESWWFLSPAHPATAGWSHVLGQSALPPALAGAAAYYRFERCDDDVAYLQLNRATNAPTGETVAAFGERVLGELRARPPARLIVDLRFNTGGDLSLGQSFIEGLAALPVAQDPARTAVIESGTTFSAGITHVVQMRTLSRATLVGAGPGDGLETWSEGGNVLLPHARINMHFADRAHTYSRAPSGLPPELVKLDLDVDSLAADTPADWTWADYIAGRDPFTQAALGQPLVCPMP